MRVEFTTLNPVKRIAAELRKATDVKLSVCHAQLAKVLGYRDWHDLERSLVPKGTPKQQNVSVEEEVRIIAALSRGLGIPAGDVQHILATVRLWDGNAFDISRAAKVRALLFQEFELPLVRRGKPGFVAECVVDPDLPEPIIVKSEKSGVTGIKHGAVNVARGNEEVHFPTVSLPLFVPHRLYFPYGYWVEEDGARVVFSRDYCPMWRLRDGKSPERMDPWYWCKWKEQHVREDVVNIFNSPNAEAAAVQWFKTQRIRSMPKLVDVLPALVHQYTSVNEAVDAAEVADAVVS